MKKTIFRALMFLALSLSLFSCTKDDSTIVLPEKMVIILNQGNYTEQSGSLSIYDERSNTITNRAFEVANGTSLGATLVSGWVDQSKQAFLVCNNADKIVVIDAKTAKVSKPAITSNLSNPRSICGDKSNIYVSNWDKEYVVNSSYFYEYTKSYISVYDAKSHAFIKKVLVGTDAEGTLLYNNNLYVATKEGVRVIDVTKTDLPIVATIRHQSALGSAKNITIDAYGKIWASFPSSGLVQIDPATQAATALVSVPVDFMDGYITCDASKERILTYNTAFDAKYNPVEAKIYAVNAASKAVTTLYTGKYFYGVGASPYTGNIFTAEVSFSSNSILKVLESNGTLKSSATAGVGTARYLFF